MHSLADPTQCISSTCILLLTLLNAFHQHAFSYWPYPMHFISMHSLADPTQCISSACILLLTLLNAFHQHTFSCWSYSTHFINMHSLIISYHYCVSFPEPARVWQNLIPSAQYTSDGILRSSSSQTPHTNHISMHVYFCLLFTNIASHVV